MLSTSTCLKWIRITISLRFDFIIAFQALSCYFNVTFRTDIILFCYSFGLANKKHYPPALGDEIWRLEKIAKAGASHKRLSQKGISCVKDFLRLYVTDPSLLREVRSSLIKFRICLWS